MSVLCVIMALPLQFTRENVIQKASKCMLSVCSTYISNANMKKQAEI
jgi:hypothetical protein